MRWPTLLCLLGLAVLPTAQADDDHEEARRLMQGGHVMPLQQLLTQEAKRHDWTILEVELEEEHGLIIYEIEWLDRQGHVHEVEYDARTGQPLDSSGEIDR